MTAAAFFVGLAIGVALTAIVAVRSYRDELAERDAWERQARVFLRQVRDQDYWGGGLRIAVRRFLGDEAGC